MTHNTDDGTQAYEYSGWTEEQAAEDSSAVASGGGKAEYWKAKVGKSVLRFLPAMGAAKPMVVTWQHYIEQPGRDTVVFACPKAMAKQPCPACAKVDKLLASKNPADRETAYGLKPKLRVFANVIDRGDVEKGPQVWGFGKTVYEQLRSLRDDPDVGDFFRPDASGFDIIVERKGTTKNDTEYHVRPSTKNAALGDMTVLEVQHEIGRFAEVMTYEEIVARIKGEKKPQGERAPAALPPVTTSGTRAPGELPTPGAAPDPFGF
jgi:hypothetical protein